MIINFDSLSAIFTAYKAAFKDGFAMAKPEWQNVATLIPSSTRTNIYGWLGNFPRMRQWLGDRVIKNMVASEYSLTNKKFEATVSLDADDIKDDSFNAITPSVQDMGFTAAEHPDELVFEALKTGNAELCYDGQFFFDTDHPTVVNGVAGTAANYDATGGGALWALLDTSRPLKPLILQRREEYKFVTLTDERDQNVFMRNEYLYGVDGRGAAGYGYWQMAYGSLNTLNETNFDAAETAMRSLKSDEDKPLRIKPTLLVVGESNRVAAEDLFERQFLASGESNRLYKKVKVLVSPYLV